MRILPALLIACSYNADAPDVPEPTQRPVDTSDTGSPVIPEGSWLAVAGVVTLQAGGVVGGQLEASVQVREPSGELVPDCGTSTTLTAATPVTVPDDAVRLYGAWSFPLVRAGCPGVPDALELGFGPLLPALYPGAERLGASTRHTRGLYTIDRTADELVVFGLAGTSSQRAGSGTPASLVPLPDGAYALDTIYLLPL
ncbi:MAG: hypothetical protein H6734_03240 [Alphaproteobacteria bacterium]|nr:hypothetical protein [Alphaproteobacteria bacterium]